MTEFDRSNERNWYRVHIDWIAAFIVRSYSEESAMLKVDYYCQANPKLGIAVEPEGSLPLYPEWAKPLEPLEEDYYQALGDGLTPVRLVEDNRRLPMSEPEPYYTGSHPHQLRLFGLNNIVEVEKW